MRGNQVENRRDHRQSERVRNVEDDCRGAVDGSADDGNRLPSKREVARSRLGALALAPVEQAPDPASHARFIHQAERVQKMTEERRHRAEGRDADVGDAAATLATPLISPACCRPTSSESLPPLIKLPSRSHGLVDDPWPGRR